MKKEHRLRKNEDFQSVFKSGKSVANRQFVVYTLAKPGQGPSRFGLSISKKIGNAVTRNRIKRLVKEVIRLQIHEMPSDMDVVIIARKPAAAMDFHDIKKSIRHVFQIAGLMKRIDHSRKR
ncbi:ribonuclease P protein component [Salisediminibacterium beveridgei]|uniref:Ribonuclease P protein component n=1 Tax=Salisediminibacterium beveridgei TaxID=632773 RepID=A0A1D7QQW9_9BACI|nr:ribonuclease P protein component [Salisediminibacterium beveridgei]AOM81407.1 Ribonuclease P protein component [Salisediminibacterium beveridgei]